MNIKPYAVLLPLLLLPACLVNNSDTTIQEKSTLLIQEISNSSAITSIIKRIVPIINGIIKEELGLDPAYDFSFFLPKNVQRITVYNLSDVLDQEQEAILSQLKKVKLVDMSPKDVSVSTQAEFFGDQQDELVVMINDPEKELLQLNQITKETFHEANDVYKKEHDRDLYNIEKSERYSFVPHMGLGRIRLQSIKNHIKDGLQINAVLERIKSRVQKRTHDILKEALDQNLLKLIFEKIGLLDLKKRAYVKEWPKAVSQ